MKKIIILAAILIFVFSAGSAHAGFGISPPTVANKNLVPGSFFQQTVYLVQSNPDEALNVAVKIDAGEINSWIKIENGNNFQIPKGNQQFPMKVSVSVPSDAQLKNYTGRITLSTSPAGGQKDGVSVVLGAEVKIKLDVGSIQISDFSIQNFRIPNAIKGLPIKFEIKVKNDGNVDNGPTKVALAFFDQYHDKKYGEYEKEITQKIKSFQTGDLSVEFPNDLEAGSYWADVKIYSGDKIAVDSKIVFNVLEGEAPGGKKSNFSFPMLNFSALPPWVYMIIGFALIIIILIAIIILLLRKNGRSGKNAKAEKENIEEDDGEIKLKIHEKK